VASTAVISTNLEKWTRVIDGKQALLLAPASLKRG
jgi:hypothetical protein